MHLSVSSLDPLKVSHPVIDTLIAVFIKCVLMQNKGTSSCHSKLYGLDIKCTEFIAL